MNVCMKNLYFNLRYLFSLSQGEDKALYDIDLGHTKMIFYFTFSSSSTEHYNVQYSMERKSTKRRLNRP